MYPSSRDSDWRYPEYRRMYPNQPPDGRRYPRELSGRYNGITTSDRAPFASVWPTSTQALPRIPPAPQHVVPSYEHRMGTAVDYAMQPYRSSGIASYGRSDLMLPTGMPVAPQSTLLPLEAITSDVTSSQRRARTRPWPRQSDTPERLAYGLECLVPEQRNIGRGMSSGRNMLAFFGSEKTARTRYNIVIERGRPKSFGRGYPESDVLLPAGLSLHDICQQYPSHVWGSGLRLFMAEGWSGEQVYHCLPLDARISGASQRKWNYLQQAMGREADKMWEEEGFEKRIPHSKKRRLSNDYADTDAPYEVDLDVRPPPAKRHRGEEAPALNADIVVLPADTSVQIAPVQNDLQKLCEDETSKYKKLITDYFTPRRPKVPDLAVNDANDWEYDVSMAPNMFDADADAEFADLFGSPIDFSAFD